MRLRTSLALLATATSLALTAAGCRRPEGPDAAYHAFAAASRAGDTGQVYGLLSERSRAALDLRAKALAAKVPGAPASGRELAIGDLAAGAPRIAKVVVVSATADAAVLDVTVEGSEKPGEVRMVREGGRWRVVLPEVAAP
jgi:hypothetical protein